MYSELERRYRKNHPNRRLIKVISIALLVVLCISLLLIKNWKLQLAFYIIMWILTILGLNLYIGMSTNKKIKTWSFWKNMRHNMMDFIKSTYDQKFNGLIIILKDMNLYTPEKIKEMREYYSNNKSQKLKPSAWEKVVLFVGSFIGIWFGIMSTAKEFTINETIISLVVFVILTFLIVIIIYVIEDLRELYKILFDRYEVEEILERLLSEIYLKLI